MVTWSDRRSPRVPTVALPPKQAPVTLTPFQRPPRLPFPGRAGRQQPFSTTTPDWGRWLLWPRCAEPARRPPGGGLWWVGGSSATLACQGSFMSQPSPDPARASSWAGGLPPPPAASPSCLWGGAGQLENSCRAEMGACNCRKHLLAWGGRWTGGKTSPPSLVSEHLTPRLKIKQTNK